MRRGGGTDSPTGRCPPAKYSHTPLKATFCVRGPQHARSNPLRPLAPFPPSHPLLLFARLMSLSLSGSCSRCSTPLPRLPPSDIEISVRFNGTLPHLRSGQGMRRRVARPRTHPPSHPSSSNAVTAAIRRKEGRPDADDSADAALTWRRRRGGRRQRNCSSSAKRSPEMEGAPPPPLLPSYELLGCASACRVRFFGKNSMNTEPCLGSRLAGL